MTFEEHMDQIEMRMQAFNAEVRDAREAGFTIKTTVSSEGMIYDFEMGRRMAVTDVPPRPSDD